MFYAKLVDHVLAIDNKYQYIKDYYRDYITSLPPEYTVSVTDTEIECENLDGLCFNKGYLETLAIYRKICHYLLDDSIILFHSSALQINGKAILFTAPSGTGKSTHARLWREKYADRVTMINDDKPLLKISDSITVYGTPYGGKDNIQSNICSEIAAIVILHQATENTIKRISSDDALPTLFSQTYRFDTIDGMTKTLPLVVALSKLPIFSLGCTISYEAVKLVYDAVFGSTA